MTYKDIAPHKDLIPEIIYVRMFEIGKWEAIGKSIKGNVYGAQTDRTEEIAKIVVSVFNSMARDNQKISFITINKKQ